MTEDLEAIDPVDERGDRRTLKVSREGNTSLERLVGRQWFADQIEAYRLAIAVALARGFEPSSLPELTDPKTKYNVGSLDPEGSVRDLIVLMRPQDSQRPYAAAEWLAEAGLIVLDQELADGRLLSEIIEGPGAGEDETDVSTGK